MDVETLLDDIRTRYIDGFLSEAQDCQSRHDVVLETPVTNDIGEYCTRGMLDLPARQDLVVITDTDLESRKIASVSVSPAFEPVESSYSGRVSYFLFPFQWNQCDIRIQDGPDEPDWSYLRQWFLKWFDEGLMDETGLSGCLHSMSDPEAVENGFRFSVDFGSAPVEAITDLLDTVSHLGFARVQLGYTVQ